ncbi:MAG: aconitase X swivel domain-containing protein [Notoacmeibacter sp.]
MSIVLVESDAIGEPLVLSAPISFWGGVSPETGTIIEKRHPQFGLALKGKILLLPAAKGSSSGSSVLAEILRNGCGPAAIILASADAILATGAMVASALYGIKCPVMVIDETQFQKLAQAQNIAISGSSITVV